jgi:hypothetical protein
LAKIANPPNPNYNYKFVTNIVIKIKVKVGDTNATSKIGNLFFLSICPSSLFIWMVPFWGHHWELKREREEKGCVT